MRSEYNIELEKPVCLVTIFAGKQFQPIRSTDY